MNPYAQGSSRVGAALFAGVLMFVLTLSALNSIGLVPDYVDGTGGFAREHTYALPDSDGKLALGDLPTLGEEPAPVLKPVVTLAEEAAKLRAESMQSTSSAPVPHEVALPPVLPERLVIRGVPIDVPVLNPQSTDVTALDKALESGVVRYPLAARLNEEGDVFIFGHSSHLPVVRNKMFKALNGIEELTRGEEIHLVADGRVYVYRVESVRKTSADEAMIDLSTNHGKRLTISTCDSFGGKSSRWVVDASFVEER